MTELARPPVGEEYAPTFTERQHRDIVTIYNLNPQQQHVGQYDGRTYRIPPMEGLQVMRVKAEHFYRRSTQATVATARGWLTMDKELYEAYKRTWAKGFVCNPMDEHIVAVGEPGAPSSWNVHKLNDEELVAFRKEKDAERLGLHHLKEDLAHRGECEIVGCQNKASRNYKGLCRKHYDMRLLETRAKDAN